MLRAARFVAQLGFTPAPRVVAAMTAMAGELARITAERVQAELSKLLLGTHPRRGLELLVDTGLADVVLPELPALRMAIDEHCQHKDVYAHTLQVLEQAIELETDGPDLVLRLAALLHDIGKPDTRRRRAGRAGELPPPRGGRREAGPQAAAGAALPARRSSTTSRSWCSCTCASTATAAASGPTRRCAATSSTPGRC